jgi:tetratricopeptide (TPR) repeat protein
VTSKSDPGELNALVGELRTTKKAKAGIFAKRKRPAKDARRDKAIRLAALSEGAQPTDDLLSALGNASAEYADEPEVRLAHARSLAAAGREPDAIAEFEEGLRLAPGDAPSLSAVAELFHRSGRLDLAVERLTRAVDIYVAAGALTQAVEAAKRLISLEPESLDHAKGLVALLRAQDPALLIEALEHLANVYRERGKLGQEADACRELLTIDPDRAAVKRRLADIYVRILEVDPEDADTWFGLATIDEEAAQRLSVNIGRNDYQTPIALDDSAQSTHDSYVLRKAQELIDAGDLSGASLCLERAVMTNDKSSIHLRLARCYHSLHRDGDAVRAGIGALTAAHRDGDEQAIEAVLTWLAALWPQAQAEYFALAVLNERPEAADNLSDELFQRWNDAQASTGVGAGREA